MVMEGRRGGGMKQQEASKTFNNKRIEDLDAERMGNLKKGRGEGDKGSGKKRNKAGRPTSQMR